MILQELLREQQLVVQITWGEQKIEFYTRVVDKNETGVFVLPYMHGKKPLVLNIVPDNGVICNLFGEDLVNKHRIAWRNVELQTITQNGTSLYFITTSTHNRIARLDERRAHERVPVQVEGIVIDANDQTIQVEVLDVSDNGFSFCAPIHFMPASTKLVLEVVDTIREEPFKFRVEGRVIYSKKGEEKYFYGCTVLEPSKEFVLYGCLKRLLQRRKLED